MKRNQKKEKPASEYFVIGGLNLLISICLLFNGFTYLTSSFIENGEIVGGNNKHKALLALFSILENGWWKYLFVLFFGLIGFLMIKEGRHKLKHKNRK
jgi:uncharacterized membrane protein